jgi:hypothetical protein
MLCKSDCLPSIWFDMFHNGNRVRRVCLLRSMMTTTSWSIEVGHHESDASAQAVRSRAGSWRYSPRCTAPAGGAMMFYTLRKHS